MAILAGVFRIQEPLNVTGKRHHTSILSNNVVRSNQRNVMYILANIWKV